MIKVAARAIAAKKGSDILALEIHKLLTITDYFLICSGRTARQTKTIADEVRKQLKGDGWGRPRRVSGEKLGDWILLDYGEAVIHIFTDEMREYYRLERLWKDAPRIELNTLLPSR